MSEPTKDGVAASGRESVTVFTDDARLAARYEFALVKIAMPKRPDGTYNLSREACEQIAKDALSG